MGLWALGVLADLVAMTTNVVIVVCDPDMWGVTGCHDMHAHVETGC